MSDLDSRHVGAKRWQNKDARKDKRENQLVKKDTRDIENEIKTLKAEGACSQAKRSRPRALTRQR